MILEFKFTLIQYKLLLTASGLVCKDSSFCITEMPAFGMWSLLSVGWHNVGSLYEADEGHTRESGKSSILLSELCFSEITLVLDQTILVIFGNNKS